MNKNSGCLTSILNIFHPQPKQENFPYRLKKSLLSPAETSFYHVLKSCTKDEYTIHTKVSLGDIFYVSEPTKNTTARNRISQKHIDFLICDPLTQTPRLAIELDDKSHQRPDRIERDKFVNGVFEAAKLPLLHIPARETYKVSELERTIKAAITQ